MFAGIWMAVCGLIVYILSTRLENQNGWAIAFRLVGLAEISVGAYMISGALT